VRKDIPKRYRRPSPPVTTRAQQVATESDDAYRAALARLDPIARRMAHDLAKGMRYHEEDLLQEGLTELWELDPSRYEVDEDEVLVSAMMNRMQRARARERKQGLVGG